MSRSSATRSGSTIRSGSLPGTARGPGAARYPSRSHTLSVLEVSQIWFGSRFFTRTWRAGLLASRCKHARTRGVVINLPQPAVGALFPCGHIVYPHIDEGLVGQAVCLFTSAGLREGDGAILIMAGDLQADGPPPWLPRSECDCQGASDSR
jgi:hypothetical protein